MRIAVTGAGGLIGRPLCEALRNAGHQVLEITRNPRQESHIGWNPDQGIVQADRLEGIGALVHLAGENIAGARWNPSVKQRIRDSRVRGTEVISRTLATLSTRPGTLICASAVGYYGDRGDELLQESSSPGHGFLAEVCQAWEAAAEPARQAGLRVVHLRLGMVLARHGGALAKMLPAFRWGVGGRIGNGKQYWSWIELSEVVNIILYALNETSLGGPVNVVAPEPVTNAEFTRTLASVLHRPAFLPMPAWAARLVLGEMADALLLASTRAIPARLQQAGYSFRFGRLQSALEHLLQTPAS
jgi:uncharacterized protein (TIGR01777 family)